MLDTCEITVTANVFHDYLQIVVRDNGPGMDAALLEKLKKGEVKPKGLGIGLKNIDDRIKIIFGEKYGLSIDSESNRGTSVAIYIPKELEVKHV
jgi:two-component system sensor histidine kinase YesM